MKEKGGFTLIDLLVASVIVGLVFVAILGAFRIALKAIQLSYLKSTALALANQKIELARNLPYEKVGTVGGIPSGIIPQTENITRNRVEFTVKTTVLYIDDPFDGTAPDDPVPTDYKRIKVKVSWQAGHPGEVFLISDIAPPGVEGESEGGTLFISVFDSQGQPVVQADVHIENDNVDPPINADYQTDSNGNLVIPGAPESIESYKITVTKPGYSTDRTYGKDEVDNPDKPHATVLKGELTEISFSIDKVSTFEVYTKEVPQRDEWSDSFEDTSKISDSENLEIGNGEVKLALTETGYASSGYLISETISPGTFDSWYSFSFNDDEPSGTTIKYQFLYFDGTDWVLIPDSDLTVNGIPNSEGFSDSPVDLFGLDKDKYPEIRVKATFETDDPSVTPILYDWKVIWNVNDPDPVPNLTFHLQGAKTIGTDAEGNPVYKYSYDHTTNDSGYIKISYLEWDSYTFSVDSEATGFDLVETYPVQPVNLLPDTTQTVILYLKAENTLLVRVKDAQTGDPIFGASVRLLNTSINYDETLPTDENGEAFFMPLQSGSYVLEISAEGYDFYSERLDISGDVVREINLIPSQ